MGVRLEQRPGMAAAADGGVEHPTVRRRAEQLDDLVDHDRPVPELLPGVDRDPVAGRGTGFGGLARRLRFRAHKQPLGRRCPGFSPRVQRTGRVEKGTPVLPVKGLPISPERADGAHGAPTAPPASAERGRARRGRVVEKSLVPSARLSRLGAIRSRHKLDLPELDAVEGAGHHHGLVRLEAGVLAQVGRDGQAPLAVDLDFRRHGTEECGPSCGPRSPGLHGLGPGQVLLELLVRPHR